MSYNNYTALNVFDDPQANAVCDYMFESLAAAFPADEADPLNLWVFQSCILSGKAAAKLRDYPGDIHNVTFEVNRPEIYDWFVKNIGTNVFKCNQISFKNRILFYPFPNLYFEIWFTDAEFDEAMYFSIYFQKLANIPPQTL